MTQEIKFTKMHGAGNDYIYVNTLLYTLTEPEKLAVAWSKPHTGIASDGLVLIGKSDIADFSMRIFNADGSEAMMCGNATRCIGKYVYEKGLTGKNSITLETLSGIKKVNLKIRNEKVEEITVDMGAPVIEQIDKKLQVEAGEFTGTIVSMGNPHFVIFVDDICDVELEKVGPQLENHPDFPDRTNVEFVQVTEKDRLRMRVWERGSGITQACGTGACASAVAAAVTGRAGETSTVIMDGGPLTIRWDKEKDTVFMTGGATIVFEGSIRL
ncbi:MAG: diaminopimelate epimerase [Tannerellaceae bacterium]|nr:diaminopimelate epimerase [Tannerellaceae bacterium]MCD8044081.1 diaminopimelate epimerase [Tannerellaceae bacterium]